MLIKRIVALLLSKLFVTFHRNKKACSLEEYGYLLKKYKEFVGENCNVFYSCFESPLNIANLKPHSFVGVQEYKTNLFFLPNDYSSICSINKGEILQYGNFDDSGYKYTGGCTFGHKLILFPRKSNHYLIFDLINANFKKIGIDFLSDGEHHYGGVCTKNGVIYQPPRSTNFILSYDILNEKINKIVLGPKWINFRYCGSIALPNGCVYFLPENGYVIKFNILNRKWCFIGKKIHGMVYDAKIGVDGNIYGFSGYGKGILKIETNNDNVVILYPNTYFGAYGTKLGINGKLYSIPGNSNVVWEYDIHSNKLKSIYSINNSKGNNYAGGCTTRNGNIHASPISLNSFLTLKPNIHALIPDDLYSYFFDDCY